MQKIKHKTIKKNLRNWTNQIINQKKIKKKPCETVSHKTMKTSNQKPNQIIRQEIIFFEKKSDGHHKNMKNIKQIMR